MFLSSIFVTKRACSAGELAETLSPLVGVFVGAAVTLLLVMGCIVVRLRSSNPEGHDRHFSPEKATLPQSDKLTNREPPDEKDPDVIPAKFGKIGYLTFLDK